MSWFPGIGEIERVEFSLECAWEHNGPALLQAEVGHVLDTWIAVFGTVYFFSGWMSRDIASGKTRLFALMRRRKGSVGGV